MTQILDQYLVILLCASGISLAAYIFFELSGIFFGEFIFNHKKKYTNQPVTLFLGATASVGLFSVIYFFEKTTQWLLISIMLYGVLWRTGIVSELWQRLFNSIKVRQMVIEMVVIILMVALRFFQLFDTADHELQTENCDMYNYMDNMMFQTMYKEENIFTEFESRYFGFNHRFSNYHFWEYNLGILLKFLWPFQNFTFFQLCLLPLILGIGIISIARVMAHYFQISYVSTLAVTLAFTTFHRATNVFWYLLKPFEDYIDINALYYFPFHAILDAYFLYPASFIPKVSVLLLGFSGYLWAYWQGNSLLRYFSIAFLALANVAYLPFIFFFEVVNILAGRFRWGELMFSFLPLVFLMLFSTLRNQGLAADMAGQPATFFFIKPIFSFKTTYLQVNDTLLYLFGNFYHPIIYCILMICVLNRNRSSVWLGIIFLSFPFLFYKYQIFGKLFIVALAGWLFLNRKSISEYLNQHPVILKFLTAFLAVSVLTHFTPFILEAFQIRLTILVLLIILIPLYVALWALKQVTQHRKIALILAGLFLINNVESNAFYFNRIFYPGTSKNFVKDFIKMFPDNRRINGVYLTRFNELLFPYTDKPGFNIQNQTDSLFTTCASFNLMSRRDTMELIRRNLFGRHQKWPFNQYQSIYGKGKTYEQNLIGFLKFIDARVVMLNKYTELPNALRPYLNDSLYCRQFNFWAYKLDTAKLKKTK